MTPLTLLLLMTLMSVSYTHLVYDQADSAGFIALYGLPIAVQAMKKLKK